MKHVISILLLLCATAQAQQGESHSYYCKTDIAAGFRYSSELHRWIPTTFNADSEFVLHFRFVRSKMEKLFSFSEKEELITYYVVTLTDKGKSNRIPCYDDGNANTEFRYAIKLGSNYRVSCSSALTDYRFNLKTGRFLSGYLEGFVNGGEDAKSDTPALTAGTCTKID